MTSKRNFFNSFVRRANILRLKYVRASLDKRSTLKYTHCKNCSTPLHGVYCHKCGQYAVDPNQSIGDYLKRFFETTYNYDKRLVNTVKALFTRPGKITTEFVAMRRSSYIDPLKLYMIASLIFFSFALMSVPVIRDANSLRSKSRKAIVADSTAKADRLLTNTDTMYLNHVDEQTKFKTHTTFNNNDTTNTDKAINNEVSDDKFTDEELSELRTELGQELKNTTPFVMMFLVPIYGLILKRQYRRCKTRYLDCFIFALHSHVIFFITLSLIILQIVFVGYRTVNQCLLGCFLIYLTIAAHNFYKVSWFKTIRKTLLGWLIYIFICMIVVVITILIKVSLNHYEEW